MLRRPVALDNQATGEELETAAQVAQASDGWGQRAPLRWRLSLVTGFIVAVVTSIMAVSTYWVVSQILTASMDRDMEKQVSTLLEVAVANPSPELLNQRIAEFRTFNPDTRVSIAPPDWSLAVGDAVPVGGTFTDSGLGAQTSVRSVGDQRIVVKRHGNGAVVAMSKDLGETQLMISTLGTVLAVLASAGILMSILAGVLVSRSGMRPIIRLQKAAEYVTQTDDLRPIEVIGNDEIAQLTQSFNEMLAALKESRLRQSQFVADAGHELKTPLTSMRTNIELLLQANASGMLAQLPEEEVRALENDVLSQMTELSSLIEDLVSLAREDAEERKFDTVMLDEVMEASLDRVRRRRPDVKFKIRAVSWILEGDEFALSRATLNLMDNAAKWSPRNGTVRISMAELNDEQVRLWIDDSGPGIPPEEREKVFERFYRSAVARKTPGSGLGLAIVKSVIEKHNGTITIHESPDGGTRMEVIFPGRPGTNEPYVDLGPDGEDEGTSMRGEIFVERWQNQQ